MTNQELSQPDFKKRRRKVAWLIFGVVLLIGLAISGLQERKTAAPLGLRQILEPAKFQERSIEGAGEDKIVLLRVEGVLIDLPTQEFFGPSGIVSIERLSRQIDQAKNDPAVKAVIVLVNSPGGTVTASQTIHEKLEQFKQSGKKIVVVMREVAASGGYYISAPADKIVANSSTITGSIGVIFQTANLQELYKKIGYEPITFKAGRLKDLGSADRPVSEEERAIIQQLLNEDYEAFVGVVSQGRKLDRSKLGAIADGRVFSGRQAKEVGLVDELGNLPKAIEVATKEAGLRQARVVEYSSALSLVEDFLGGLLGSSQIEVLSQQLTKRGDLAATGPMYLWLP